MKERLSETARRSDLAGIAAAAARRLADDIEAGKTPGSEEIRSVLRTLRRMGFGREARSAEIADSARFALFAHSGQEAGRFLALMLGDPELEIRSPDRNWVRGPWTVNLTASDRGWGPVTATYETLSGAIVIAALRAAAASIEVVPVPSSVVEDEATPCP